MSLITTPLCLLAVLAPTLWGCAPAAPATLTLAAGGDVVFGRVREGVLHDSLTAEPMLALPSVVRTADLFIVNLETPLCAEDSEHLDGADAYPRFAAAPARAETIASAGIDAVSVANNHALDCGIGGIRDTERALEAVGVRTVGVGRVGDPLAAIGESGKVVSVLAATVLWPPPERRPRAGLPIRALTMREAADRLPDLVRQAVGEGTAQSGSRSAVVVFLHWGRERGAGPSDSQVDLAHALIDAGAIAVIGSGSHRLEPVEVYRRRLIAYGLGDLIFDRVGPGGGLTALVSATYHETPRGFELGSLGVTPRWLSDSRGLHLTDVPSPAGAAELSAFVQASRIRFATTFLAREGTLTWLE